MPSDEKPKPKLDEKGQKLIQLLKELPREDRLKVIAVTRAIVGQPKPPAQTKS